MLSISAENLFTYGCEKVDAKRLRIRLDNFLKIARMWMFFNDPQTEAVLQGVFHLVSDYSSSVQDSQWKLDAIALS